MVNPAIAGRVLKWNLLSKQQMKRRWLLLDIREPGVTIEVLAETHEKPRGMGGQMGSSRKRISTYRVQKINNKRRRISAY